MEKFDTLQDIWNQQSVIEPKLSSETFEIQSFKKIKSQKAKHYWTIGILITLILILIIFYAYIFNIKIMNRINGLALMIFVMIIRCSLEITSIIRFKRINFTTSLKIYSDQSISYYKLRKAIHLFCTPVIYLLYIVGFISMLPLFEENLSEGFYLYVVISGFGFLIFFSFLLYRIIKKDFADLKYLLTCENSNS